MLVFSNQENQEYLKKNDAILINHKHPTEIIKKYEIYQIQFENPTINSSLKYSVNDKILDDEYNKNQKNQCNDNKKNKNLLTNGIFKKSENNINFTSNQGDNNTNNGLLDINGHYKAEMLERNKLTCSFRKLKSNHIHSKKNSNVNFTSNNGLDDNNSSYIKPPFQYASINNKNQNNNYNTFNSNLNKSIVNNYNTRETIAKRKNFYQSVNQSILNCSALAIKIFWTNQEQTAKNIEDGFEKLQKLARNLKIIDFNHKNSKLVNILKYDDLFDILEFKGMEKERDIIDKNIQKKKMGINGEIKKPFKSTRNLTNLSSHNLNKIEEENTSSFCEIKKNYTKNNYESHSKIDLNEKEISYNSDREVPTFNKENFLSLATLNSTTKNIKEFELLNSQKHISKENYGTNVHNGNYNLKVFNIKSCLFSKEKEDADNNKDKVSILTKLRDLEGIENDGFSDEDFINNKNDDNKTIINNPFKLGKNLNTASKGFPPRNGNIFASSKKKDLTPHNFTTNKKLKVNEFTQSPTSRSSFKMPNDNKYNFNEKLEMAAQMPFAVKMEKEEMNSKINFFTEKVFENRKKDNIKNHLELNKKNAFIKGNQIINNQFEETNRISEKIENYDSASQKKDSNISEFNNEFKKKNILQNPFKKQNQKLKNNYKSGNKKLNNNYASNYSSNNHMSNFNSNMKERSSIYVTNDNNNKSNYDTYDMKETINENSHITSGSIISCNMDFDSNMRSNNVNNYNGDTNNVKTNDIYGSNSFGDYNSENAFESQFCSNISNLDPKNDFKSNYKNFKNDFDNYEEYESAMRKMELGIEDLPKKGNKNENKRNIKNSIGRPFHKKINSVNSNINATESDYISDFSKNSKLSNNSQINNFSYITRSSVSDIEI